MNHAIESSTRTRSGGVRSVRRDRLNRAGRVRSRWRRRSWRRTRWFRRPYGSGHASGGHGGSSAHFSGGHSSSFGHVGHVSSGPHFAGHANSGPHYSGNHSFSSLHHNGYNNGHNHLSYNRYPYRNGFNNNYGRGYYNYGRYNRGWPYRGYAYRNYSRYDSPYVYGLGYFNYPFLSNYFGYPSSYYYNSYPAYYSSYPTYYGSTSPDYYANSSVDPGDTEGNLPSPGQNAISNTPIADTARLEIRLPDPQASIWVEGQSIASNGAVRQFNSPQLDPSRQFTYDVKAAWIENGRLVTDERRVKVQANGQSVIDFTRPAQSAPDAGRLPSPKPLPPQQQES